MKALILAGGFANRLRPLTDSKPKPMLPIANKPVIAYNIDKLIDFGVEEIIVSTNNLFQNGIMSYLEKTYPKIKFSCVVDVPGENNQKMGVVKAMNHTLNSAGIEEECIIIAGDNILGFDLKSMYRFHKHNNADATIALYNVGDLEKAKLYGLAELNPKKQITKFAEKPKEPKSTLASTACYILNKEIVTTYLPRFVKDEKNSDNLGDLFVYLLGKASLYGFEFSDYWYDVGSPKPYIEANSAMMKIHNKNEVEKDAKIGEGTKLSSPVFIGKNVEIGKNCFIGPCTILMDDCKVGDNCRIFSSVIYPQTKIGNACELKQCIISDKASLKDFVDVQDFCIIGNDTEINEKCRILQNSKIGAGRKVEKETTINGSVF